MQDVRSKLGTPRCGKRVRGLARAARRVGVGLEPRGRPRSSMACQGVHGAPGSRLHLTGGRRRLQRVSSPGPHSPPEVKGHRAAEPVGALQARRAAAPRGSEPAANASSAAPPPPAGPTLATRHSPPAAGK